MMCSRGLLRALCCSDQGSPPLPTILQKYTSRGYFFTLHIAPTKDQHLPRVEGQSQNCYMDMFC